jgi:transposase
MLSDAQWSVLEPLVEICRPKGKTPPQDLRRTISAILWRHQNGAKWRAVPADLGPWWRAAQVFIRWARLGVWERLLALVQERGSGWCFSTAPTSGLIRKQPVQRERGISS